MGSNTNNESKHTSPCSALSAIAESLGELTKTMVEVHEDLSNRLAFHRVRLTRIENALFSEDGEVKDEFLRNLDTVVEMLHDKPSDS